MKHFEDIINHMIEVHKDPNTIYSPTHMFGSQMELSFAVSRLMDANKIFTSDTLENKEISLYMREMWFNIREDMPKETAQDIAICIMKNTPLSSTTKQIDSTKHLFYNAMHAYTNNVQLSNAFTEIFFFSGVQKS